MRMHMPLTWCTGQVGRACWSIDVVVHMGGGKGHMRNSAGHSDTGQTGAKAGCCFADATA